MDRERELRRMRKLSLVDESEKSERQMETLDASTITAFNNITKDKRFVKHRLVLEKVCKYIEMSKDNNKKWVNKCRELTAKIAADESKYKETLRVLEQCESTNETLKKKTENNLKAVAEARQRENRARETIRVLNEQLARAAEEKAKAEEELGLSNRKKLLERNEELMLENERLLEKISALEGESVAVKEAQKLIDEEKRELNETIEQCNREIQLYKIKCRNETNRKNKVEEELLISKHNLEKITSSFEEQRKKLETTQMNETCFSKQLEVKARDLEKAVQELESSRAAMKNLQQEFDIQAVSLKELTSDCVNKTRDLKMKDDKIAEIKKELIVFRRQYQSTVDKNNALGSEADKLTLKAENESLTKQYDHLRQQCEDLGKQLSEVRDEKDRMTEEMMEKEEEMRKIQSQLLTHQHLRQSLNTQIKKLENEVKGQAKTVVYLEREKARGTAYVGELQAKIDFLQEELKAQECLNYPKQLAHADEKIANAMKLKENLQKERNNYEKKCKEAFDEVEQMKDIIQRQDQQINYLKEWVARQNLTLKTTAETLELSYKDNHQVTSKLREKRDEYNYIVLEKKSLEERCNLLTSQLYSLSKEKDLLQQKLEKIVKEKHVLSTQLVRRNEEIKLLGERLKVQERTLSSGAMQYKQLEQDSYLLKTHAKTLVRAKTLMSRQVASALKLRKELLQVHRDLIEEQTRARALEEELLSPINIHRWRILEGTDPEKYEMLRKIHTLQKQLIAKTQILVEQSVEIKTKERLLKEMKDFVSRLPKTDTVNRLQSCISQLTEKDKALKAVQCELNIYKAYAEHYEGEIKLLKQRYTRNAGVLKREKP